MFVAGLVACVLLALVLALRGDLLLSSSGADTYGQEPPRGLARLFLLSPAADHDDDHDDDNHHHHRPDQPGKLGQRTLFHVPPKDLRLPAYFNLIDPEPEPATPPANDTATTTTTTTDGGVDFNCTLTSTTPRFHICVYPRQQDIYISAALTSQGVWEPHITKLYQLALRRFPQAVVIDVGANIGYYSLLAAAMGHRVVAVEPSGENVRRLRRGVRLNAAADKVCVLRNALARTHRNVSLSVNANNQGGIQVLEEEGEGPGGGGRGERQTTRTIVLDDLISLVRGTHTDTTTTSDTATVIIKIDIGKFFCFFSFPNTGIRSVFV